LLRAGKAVPTSPPEPVTAKEVPTFAAFVQDQWWNTYPAAAKNRPATLREKRKHLDLHLMPALGSVALSAIDRRAIDGLFASLTRKGLSPKYTRNIGGTLHKILTTAVEWDVLEKIPRFPKIRLVDPDWDWFTAEETTLLLRKARDAEEYALLLFPFDTGARAGEQLGLEWGDLDLHHRKVVFRRAVSEGVLGPTKTGKARHVPLTGALVDAL
jgi:integrase